MGVLIHDMESIQLPLVIYKHILACVVTLLFQPLYPHDLFSNSPYCLPYIAYNFSLENFVLSQW